MNIEEIKNYSGLGRAVSLTNNQYRLIVTLDVGPRILWFSLLEGENILVDDVQESAKLPDGKEWHLYGGHRVWHSPESLPRTYMTDSLSVEIFESSADAITIWQKEEPWTHIQKGMDVRMRENGIEIVNRIKNLGAWPIKTAVWAITTVSSGGRAVCPVILTDTGLLPNACYVTWPYTRLNDDRVTWGEKYITLKCDPRQKDPFKFGYSNSAGWAAYLKDGLCFIKQYQHIQDVVYPDFGCSFECYTADWGMEMETLSPLQTVKPGETIAHREYWSLKEMSGANQGDERAAEEISKSLLPIS